MSRLVLLEAKFDGTKIALHLWLFLPVLVQKYGQVVVHRPYYLTSYFVGTEISVGTRESFIIL
jgi:hypothetical protein